MTEKDTNEWPSVNLAYDFVKPSYDWLQSRLDAVHGRIQSLLTFSASVTVAMPVFVKTLFPEVDFASLWFIAAIVIFVLIAVMGIGSRMISGVELISPRKLYEKWLAWSEWEFKKNAIFWAGKHFDSNASLVKKKGNCADVMSVLLAMEILSIVLWVAIST